MAQHRCADTAPAHRFDHVHGFDFTMIERERA
jgi:hypothetical protein